MSIKDQGDSLTLAKGHSVFEFRSFYFSKTVELFKTKYHVQRRAAQRSRRHLTRESEVLGRYPVWPHTSFLLLLIQEGPLLVTGECMCTKYWLTA